MKEHLSFATAPGIGATLKQGDHAYRLVDVRPYVRQDGGETSLLVWQGACAECGRGFEIVTSLALKALSRRCEKHRKPGQPASPQAARNIGRHFGRRNRRTGV